MTNRSRIQANPRRWTLALPILVTSLFMAATATAYQGYGDTGWTEDNQRDCCDDAVSLAQDDSAGACRTAGGEPKIGRGFNQGLCDWNFSGDTDNPSYRCTATADVDCW